MLASLRFVVPVASLSLIACSGNNFDLGSPTSSVDSGAAQDDVGGVPDDAGTEGTDADAGGNVDSAPVCETAAPPLACAAPSTDYSPQFQYPGGTSPIGPRIDTQHSHAISYVTDRSGRHEKMILRIRRIATGTIAGAAGRLTLTAYRTPCPGVHIPLGRSRSHAAETLYDGDVSFYFNDEYTMLPLFPAGTRLTFVLSTDSTAFAFELVGNPAPTDAPGSLKWYVKKEGGAWNVPAPALPNAQAWLRYCPT